jgi:hypothetical protein
MKYCLIRNHIISMKQNTNENYIDTNMLSSVSHACMHKNYGLSLSHAFILFELIIERLEHIQCPSFFLPITISIV